MKFFSLETKKHLVGWSVVTGFAVSLGILFLTYRNYWCNGGVPYPDMGDGLCISPIGWPFAIDVFRIETWFDFTFEFGLHFLIWILIVFIILSLVRHFRKKNQQVTTK